MKPIIYFNQQPCNEAKRILLDYFQEDSVFPEVIWTGLKEVRCNVVVATPCTGTDHVSGKTIINLDDEFKSDIGDTVTSTAEHTLSLMLQLAKKARIQLNGKTLGIIGHGRIGGLLADYCNALGMKILTYDIKHNLSSELEYLLESSDVISLHIPLNGNENLIGSHGLGKMKKECLFINTSRQGIINIDDITVSIKNNSIYYADDFSNIRDLAKVFPERVIQTPHIAGNSKEAREITDVWLANKLIQYWRSLNP